MKEDETKKRKRKKDKRNAYRSYARISVNFSRNFIVSDGSNTNVKPIHARYEAVSAICRTA
jgi:hypothetical protein